MKVVSTGVACNIATLCVDEDDDGSDDVADDGVTPLLGQPLRNEDCSPEFYGPSRFVGFSFPSSHPSSRRFWMTRHNDDFI